jgi:superfamily II DNA or RNA helicase
MPASLADTIHQSFSRNARTRGEEYFRYGFVSRTHVANNVFSATVSGTYDYKVRLTLDGERLTVKCTCPYFLDVVLPCKHIWASVLAADEEGAFAVPASVRLETDHQFRGVVPGDALHAARSPASPTPGGRPVPSGLPSPPRQPPPAWKTFLTQVVHSSSSPLAHATPRGELIYVVAVAPSLSVQGLLLEIQTRERKKSGEWGKPKPLAVDRSMIKRLTDARDRELLEAIVGGEPAFAYSAPTWSGFSASAPIPNVVILNETQQRDLAQKLCETGRLLLRRAAVGKDSQAQFLAIDWDPAPATFRLTVGAQSTDGYRIGGCIESDAGERSLDDALLVTNALILWKPEEATGHPRLSPFHPGNAEPWISALRTHKTVTVPFAETDALLEALATADLSHVECPDELRADEQFVPPKPVLRISRQAGYGRSYDRLSADLSFIYGDLEVDPWSDAALAFDRRTRTAFRRDPSAEREAIARLTTLGVRMYSAWHAGTSELDLAESSLPGLVRALVADGWRVEAEGRVYRSPGAATLDVRSGVDWFELHGRIDFGGVSAELPALLAAARKRERFVQLADGSVGLLPDEWLARTGRLATAGSIEPDHLRFAKSQAALLDAWLAAEPAVSCDEAFAKARQALSRFERVEPVEPPRTFRGVLRPYQRDALAWFAFLREFGFGGCLADEMGLGKTVMVLAALESRRRDRERAREARQPSLIVVPRSLIFNWRLEASRFAPKLEVLDYTGTSRRDARDRVSNVDVVLTTYGTLRRDVGELKSVIFDYVILDEAQAIKNAGTASAKAARLLKAQHRLALTGTPVENHLGELWSLFEFLNPGALGSASFVGAAGSAGRNDDGMLEVVARAVRPFILRRTKDQVASELPERTEQTIYCDLETPQRTLYNELRDHYRAALLGQVARDGLSRSKLQILEALLRLRQAACHPGLIDQSRSDAASAKLDVLVPRLQELVDEGHKVIVFSQFTSFLALLRPRLEEARLAYEYLDGRTRDREARVRRFQETDCPLFLVSLKAGGLGLNLTAAEYVFLLDPWWNPAVEAQAIDRAHRIGQRRPVFAFRLIARDTVEEKVLELQASKRKLADAIVRADESLIRDLRKEDLELLLA